MKFELRSDENKIIGFIEVDKDFDKNNFIYLQTENLKLKLNFNYECNKCGEPLKHDCIGVTIPFTAFTCKCGEFEGSIARKGYYKPHLGLIYKQYTKQEINQKMKNEIKIIKKKYKDIS